MNNIIIRAKAFYERLEAPTETALAVLLAVFAVVATVVLAMLFGDRNG